MEEFTLRLILSKEIAKIQNSDIKALVRAVLDKVPEDFWKRETSLTYHPEDERGLNGNLLHTLRVLKLVDTIVQIGSWSRNEHDALRAAAILHDCLRHGLQGKMPYSHKDHAGLVRRFIESHKIESNWSDEICSVIESHYGKWGKGIEYIPTISPRAVLLLADYIAAREDVEVKIFAEVKEDKE